MDQFRHKIHRINTYKFETFDFIDTSMDKVGLEMEVDFKKLESNLIEIITHFKFFYENPAKTLLSISAGITYDIHPEDFAQIKQSDGAIVMPHPVALYFAGFVIGATRGILSVRTENTKFSQFILPPITLANSITGDVKIMQPNMASA